MVHLGIKVDLVALVKEDHMVQEETEEFVVPKDIEDWMVFKEQKEIVAIKVGQGKQEKMD